MQSIEECDIMQDSPVKEICQNGPKVSRVSKGNGVDISSWSKPLQDHFHRSSENLNENQKISLSDHG